MPTLILFATLSLLVAVLLAKGIRIVKQSEAMIVERLGKYHRTLESGINVIIPVIDRPRQINWRYTETGFNGEIISIFKLQDRIDLRENVYDFPKQNVITRDNVAPSSSSRLRSRSWVIGLAGATFSICSAMAFASTGPTQIGNAR
mgnify:CR=1 FL=1